MRLRSADGITAYQSAAGAPVFFSAAWRPVVRPRAGGGLAVPAPSPCGWFVIEATAAGITVHKAECRSDAQHLVLCEAMLRAWETAVSLAAGTDPHIWRAPSYRHCLRDTH